MAPPRSVVSATLRQLPGVRFSVLSGCLNNLTPSAALPTRVQALPDEPQERPIGNPNLEHLLALGAIQAVCGGHDVGLENPTHLALLHDPVQDTKGVIGTTSGS